MKPHAIHYNEPITTYLITQLIHFLPQKRYLITQLIHFLAHFIELVTQLNTKNTPKTRISYTIK